MYYTDRIRAVSGAVITTLLFFASPSQAAPVTLVDGFSSAPISARTGSDFRVIDRLILNFDTRLDGFAGDFSFRPGGVVYGSTIPWSLRYLPDFLYPARGHLNEPLPVEVTATYGKLIYDPDLLQLSFIETVSPYVPDDGTPDVYPGDFDPLIVSGARCSLAAGASFYDFATALTTDCTDLLPGTLLTGNYRFLSTSGGTLTSVSVSTAPIPLPPTLAFMGVSLMGLFAFKRLGRRSAGSLLDS